MSLTVKQLDQKFEQYCDSIEFEVSETQLTPALRAERRMRADSDEFEFCKIYYPQIFKEVFNGVHLHIKRCETGRFGVSGSRFYGKTAYGYVSKLIKRIVKGGGMHGLGRRTEDIAKERTAAVYRLIDRNELLKYDYSVNVQQEKKGHYIINNAIFVAFGAFEGLRNFISDEFERFDTIILDDLYDRLSVRSEKDNERIYNFVSSEVEGQLNEDGLMLWFFNMIIETSPGAKFADNYPDRCFNYPALNENGETNWPGHSKYTTEYLRNKEASLDPEVWAGDWMNKPLQRGEIFEPDWLRGININLVKIVSSLTAIDPSIGKSPSACYKGIITIGKTETGQNVVLDIYSRKEDYNLVFDYVDAQRAMWPGWKVLLFENDFAQWFAAAKYYEDWSEKRKKVLPIVVFTTQMLATESFGTDKESRIMNLVHPHQTGKLVYNNDIMNNKDFERFRLQYLAFGKSTEKLDALDAEATAFIMLNRYVEHNTFKPLGKRKFKEFMSFRNFRGR